MLLFTDLLNAFIISQMVRLILWLSLSKVLSPESLREVRVQKKDLRYIKQVEPSPLLPYRLDLLANFCPHVPLLPSNRLLTELHVSCVNVKNDFQLKAPFNSTSV